MVSPERSSGGHRIGDPGSIPHPRRALGPESGGFGISQSASEMATRFNSLPEDASDFVDALTSRFLEEDLARDYVRSRPQRKYVARTLEEQGVKGKELGQIMRDLHSLAQGNAQPRR